MLSSICLILIPLSIQEFSSEARLKSGEIFYRELHREIYSKDHLKEALTTYLSAEGLRIAELNSTYNQLPGLPTYHFIDFRTGYEDGVEVGPEKIRVFLKKNKESQIQEREFKPDERLISGQGFNHRVRLSLEEIIQNGSQHFHLIMPSRLDFYQFRVRARKVSETEAQIRLEIDNWLLRFFAPHLDVTYERKTGRLFKYEGISNIADETGNHPFVSITYKY